MKDGFGIKWGRMGTEYITVVRACVGGIDPDSTTQAIGLSNMQMDNLGHNPRAIYRVSLNDNTEKHIVQIWIAFGMRAFDDDQIWVTKKLANKLQLQLGDVITIERIGSPLCRRER